MTTSAWLQIILYLGVLLALAAPLGVFMGRVFEGQRTRLHPLLGPVERLIYRLSGVDPDAQMDWKTYALAILAFNLAGLLVTYAVQRLQGVLPLNPEGFSAVSPDLAFNTAVSFATNTNWQSYGGEGTLSRLTQMLALGVQNFVSAASGIACLLPLIRGFTGRTTEHLGNFWADLVRATLYVLLPLSVVFALFLASQGVVQTFAPDVHSRVLDGTVVDGTHKPISEQVLAVGPVASQVAIKQLGTNGGGYYNANSAHPFENPTPLTNFLECLAILLIPAALCWTFGHMVRDPRQGRALLAAMLVIFVPLLVLDVAAESVPGPALAAVHGVDATPSELAPGGNMEGKEVRFGPAASAIWAVVTTAASNGSVDAAHDSLTPLGGLIPMWLMQLGEVVFGGVGSGLYGLILFAIVAVFVAGLMVGRTPEYLGKKIEAREMKMASLAILVPCIVVLVGTAVAVRTAAGKAAVGNPGIHGFSEILYAFSSAGNNNGSAFGGLSANIPFYNVSLGLAMFIARYWVMLPVLAIAGSLAKKRPVVAGAGTMPTHGPLFVTLLVGVVLLVGALTFIPALALGPIAEQLQRIQ